MVRPCGVAATLRRLARIARTGAFVLAGSCLLALYVLAIWHAPEYMVNQDLLAKATPEQRLPAEHNARLIVISVGGALVVGTGLLYTARNYRLAHRGQVTERFTKALERLGSDELYVRTGGIHALEHVMRDSPDHRNDVVEVLVAFIRDRAPRRSLSADDTTQWMHPPIGSESVALPDEPDPDVQAALVALGKRPDRSKDEQGWAFLADLYLKRVNLRGARLNHVNLERAQLQTANMTRTQLRHARLKGAQLRGSFMLRANLQHALLEQADLENVLLVGAQLQHAALRSANLQNAVLVIAQLQHATLRGAQLQNADLTGARLQNADLTGAQLQNANLTGARLQGARLTGAAVTTAQLRTAVLSEKTILPTDLE